MAEMAMSSKSNVDRWVRRCVEKEVQIRWTTKGLGVFSRKPYPVNSVIGEILGDVVEDACYGSEYCMSLESGRQLEPFPPFRYVNHSCDPNCEFDWFDTESEYDSEIRQRVFLIAVREIMAGEELTIDYNWSAEMAIPCRCQAPSCRGWIVSVDELSSLRTRILSSTAIS